jgi:hypothetical protein
MFKIDITSTLGVDDFIRTATAVKLFPNPSIDYIQISGLTKTEGYNIYNILGAEVNNGNITNNEKIDIRNLTNGLYFLELKSGNSIKFMKR